MLGRDTGSHAPETGCTSRLRPPSVLADPVPCQVVVPPAPGRGQASPSGGGALPCGSMPHTGQNPGRKVRRTMHNLTEVQPAHQPARHIFMLSVSKCWDNQTQVLWRASTAKAVNTVEIQTALCAKNDCISIKKVNTNN